MEEEGQGGTFVALIIHDNIPLMALLHFHGNLDGWGTGDNDGDHRGWDIGGEVTRLVCLV